MKQWFQDIGHQAIKDSDPWEIGNKQDKHISAYIYICQDVSNFINVQFIVYQLYISVKKLKKKPTVLKSIC